MFCMFLSTLFGQKQNGADDTVGHQEHAGDGGRVRGARVAAETVLTAQQMALLRRPTHLASRVPLRPSDRSR
jgi:hypothetical protein